MMEKYEIQKLRELPIEKVAKEMGIKVEHHKALCPFHDDHHASLTFSKTKNSCRCYVCMSNSIGTIDLERKQDCLNMSRSIHRGIPSQPCC